MQTRVRRSRKAVGASAALVGAAVLAVAVATAAPASAVSVTGPGSDASYYRTSITSVIPAVAGVQLTVDPAGNWIKVSNATSTELTVLGYGGEPYLRLGPGGTQENETSLSAAINGTAYVSAQTIISAASAVRPVHWVTVSATPTFAWHDHRIHWMSATRPPLVATDAQHAHPVSTWTVQLRYGAQLITATGRLDWLGRPALFANLVSTWLWAAAVLAVAFLLWRLLAVRRARAQRADHVAA